MRLRSWKKIRKAMMVRQAAASEEAVHAVAQQSGEDVGKDGLAFPKLSVW